MARIILKSPYLKPNAKTHVVNYLRYIATREGVENPVDSKQLLPATAFQQKTIAKLIQDYPDTTELYEYVDYTNNSTRENADEFMIRAAETHAELFGSRERYVDYIANRPGVVNIAENGLFSDAGQPIVLRQAMKEVAEHTGNIWTHIISLQREDADRLGYSDVAAWQELLRRQRNVFAKNMKIKPENFRWYAAFHNKDHHPHIHMIAFSAKPNEPWLTEKGIQEIKSSLAKQIFKNDLIQIYDQQTVHRDALRHDSREVIADIVGQINNGGCYNPEIETLLVKLAGRLENLSGKKQYGYLPADVKATVDRIVNELVKDERIAKLYDLWYGQREQVLATYISDKMPDRLPLSQQSEFKSIKNAVISEALKLVEQKPQIVIGQSENNESKSVISAPTIKSDPIPSSPPAQKPLSHVQKSSLSALGIFRLTGFLASLMASKIKDEQQDDHRQQQVDRKIMRAIEEKKRDMGLK